MLKIFSGSAHPDLAKNICRFLSTDLGKAKVTTFPDGESCVQLEENVRGADVFIVQPTSAPSNHHIMELLVMIDTARRASAKSITAVLPFYGYARQDRKDKPRVPISAKLVANLITTAGADRVLTMDLHAAQIQGFFDIPLDHLNASPIFIEYARQNFAQNALMIMAPDAGSIKTAQMYAAHLKTGFGFVAKRRMDAENVEAVDIVGDVKDKDVLLIDDMTESVGTLINAAKLCRANGARKVNAMVTHAALTTKGFERLEAQTSIDQLIVTDTIALPRTSPKLKVLSVAPLFARAISSIHENTSVTGLFDIKGV